jgi:2-oxoglutarate dehydrogenase E1 component
MEQSLAVPTATSFRDVPAKLLEINRRVINGHLGRTTGSKISFTHIIGYAIVRAIADSVPAMGSTFAEDADGRPLLTQHPHVNLGLAIDLEKRGGRTLVVPKIAAADALNFAEFCDAYDDVVERAKANKLTPDDFAGVTVTLTNPGTIGTKQSVPRLMPGQSVIVGVGAMNYPSEWAGADARTIAKLGLSKVMTMTSTYDHRVIQGAESGMFLKQVEALLLGGNGFYKRLFKDMGVPYVSVEWRNDTTSLTSEVDLLEKQMGVATLINMYRSRGHLIAALDPLSARAPEIHEELDPAAYGLTIAEPSASSTCTSPMWRKSVGSRNRSSVKSPSSPPTSK